MGSGPRKGKKTIIIIIIIVIVIKKGIKMDKTRKKVKNGLESGRKWKQKEDKIISEMKAKGENVLMNI